MEWTKFDGFDTDARVVDGDAQLLNYIRRRNPRLDIQRIEHRWNATIRPVDQWTLPATPTRLKIHIVRNQRLQFLQKATSGATPSVQERFIKSATGQIVVAIDFSQAIPSSSGIATSHFQGVKIAAPGAVFAVNPDLQYTLSSLEPGSGNVVAKHNPTEVFLIQVKRIR